MARVMELAALAVAAVSAPAYAQYDGPGHGEPRGGHGVGWLFTGVEIEGGFENSSSNIIDGHAILGALTVDARDVSDTHDGARRIALRGVHDSGGPVEVSIAVSYTEAEAKPSVVIGAVGLDAITGSFDDYEKLGIELGARRYFGDRYATLSGSHWRSFIGGSVGIARTEAMDVVLQSDGFSGLGLGLPDVIASGLYDDSWTPTVSVTGGMQYRLTRHAAIEGVLGARYDAAPDENDDELSLLGLEAINDTQGRVSYPFLLRGRFAR